jgi:1-acyl-sn-glycerol-3-phosphate acyltransferase
VTRTASSPAGRPRTLRAAPTHTTVPDHVRARLNDLLTATDAELRRRGVIRLAAPPPSPIRPAAARSARRARLAAALPAPIALAPVPAAQRLSAVRASHRDGRYPVDDFGFDQEWTEVLLPIFRLVYRRYWRVTTTGMANVPRRGAALLVSNHSGVLPFDGAMIKVAAFEEGLDRHIRALIAGWFFGLPVLSWFLRRTGQTLGHQDDTLRLLRAGELVLVFPEGVRGAGKPFTERYRLRRFGRGGFAEVAIRARAPIVPVSVVGAEEIYPMLADIRPLADLVGFPYCPVTPSWPWLGPLGLVPLPSKWRIEFHAPVRTDEMPVEAADDPATVMSIGDQVRDTIQEGLIANLMERRSVFRG